jgi:hypothetical protein
MKNSSSGRDAHSGHSRFEGCSLQCIRPSPLPPLIHSETFKFKCHPLLHLNIVFYPCWEKIICKNCLNTRGPLGQSPVFK